MHLTRSFARKPARFVGACLAVLGAGTLVVCIVLTPAAAQAPAGGAPAATQAPTGTPMADKGVKPVAGEIGLRPVDHSRPIDSPYAKAAFAAMHAPLDKLTPVTDEMLRNPPPGDWLNWRRTYDGWGYSPLTQINRKNVKDLKVAWTFSMDSSPMTRSTRPRRSCTTASCSCGTSAKRFRRSTRRPAPCSGKFTTRFAG